MDAADPFELREAIRVAGLEHLFTHDRPVTVAHHAEAPAVQESTVVDVRPQLQEAA